MPSDQQSGMKDERITRAVRIATGITGRSGFHLNNSLAIRADNQERNIDQAPSMEEKYY
jgi:hypothetical protein